MSIASDKAIYVSKSKLPDLEKYTDLLRGVWESRQLTNDGPLLKRLEAELQSYLGSQYLNVVSNGTVAIQLALRALGMSGSVITTPFSYVATTTALLHEGITPLFADVRPDDLNLDADKVEALVRPDTRAVLATHVYGNPCDDDALRAVCDRHGLSLIYDAAHAFGVSVGGRSILNWGQASTVSLHATKGFHTAEGGMVIAADADLHRQIKLLRAFGHVGRDYYREGTNAKLSELHAAMGLLNLADFDEHRAARRRVWERYEEQLRDSILRIVRSSAVDLDYNYAYFPVLFPDEAGREKSVAYLNERGIYPRRYFEPALNQLPYLTPRSRQSCPIAESATRRVLCLPLYVDLLPAEQDRVITALRESLAA